MPHELATEILVVGGGVGGVAAALAALGRGRKVILSNDTAWLGGQLTAQAVPPDEHRWSEQVGLTATYRAFREAVRAFYRRWYPLTHEALRARYLNPGAGSVSPLCHEPLVAVQVLNAMLMPYASSGQLTILSPYQVLAADVTGEVVDAVRLAPVAGDGSVEVHAGYVIDASETGDLLPLSGTEYVIGSESQQETGEPHASEKARPGNMQGISWCFAVDHVPGDHTIDRPESYEQWSRYRPDEWPAQFFSLTVPNVQTLEPRPAVFLPNFDRVKSQHPDLPCGALNLWTYRRIAAESQFRPGAYESDITLVNWPMNDYFLGPIIEVDDQTRADNLRGARELSLSLLYWLQTEVPRPDGGTGYPGLRLRGDIVGTADGLAQAPYIRESRRIRALTTVVEQSLSPAVRGKHGAERYRDSVGIGSYHVDLHPSTEGDSYIDFPSCPFQIPLRALIPQRMVNLLPGAKNIGTTHLTNGCYRLHPVEWNVGEVAGTLAAFCLDHGIRPQAVPASEVRLDRFQAELVRAGVELGWPEYCAI